MFLRRITLERYGCFGSGEFEFRRGLNLLYGGNEAGKSLLLAALPAVVLGVEHGMRLRSWGDSLSCRAALLFEGQGGAVRLTRELENHLVRLEERDADGQWRESFAGRVPPAGNSPDRQRYFAHLERLFGVAGETLLRVLLDAVQGEMVLDGEGRLAGGLAASLRNDPVDRPIPADHPDAAAARQTEISALEAELANGLEEYRKGEEYLAWIRKRWEKTGKALSESPPGRPAALERQHQELAAELQAQGLPRNIPADLPELFVAAEGLRQELAVLQQELVPLQRNRQAVSLPPASLPLIVTLVCLAAPGVALYLDSPWLAAVAGVCATVLLLSWGVFLTRLFRARKVRAGLDREIEAVEQKRAAATVRQGELAERFEAGGLPSTPVEMVKLQQLCQRHQTLIDHYHEVRRQLGLDAPELATADRPQADDKHLRPEELPHAEQRLAELSDSLRRCEARLRVLRDGSPAMPGGASASQALGTLDEKCLLPAIGQLLDRLTGGRFREVRLEDGRFHLEAAPGQWVAPAGCSRGTAEALGLAVRLALYRASGALLPLPIDDLPASFEPRRRQAALRLLEKWAADHQILLATCEEELSRRALRERWQLIDLNQKQVNQPDADKETADAGQLHLL